MLATAEDKAHDAFSWTVAPPDAGLQDAAAEQRPLPVIKTDEDLDAFLLDFFGITLPNVRCCEGHSTPWQAFHDAYFARSPVAVWKASRGFGGKSFTLALLSLTEALTLKADVNVLGGSGEQSERILESITKLWDAPNAPREYLQGAPGARKQVLTNGAKLRALLASQRSVRGPHPQRLRLDEVDEMALPILKSALGQPMSRGWVLAQVVLSSTHQNADGTMTWAINEAAAKGWPVYEWCLKETMVPHGWLTQAEVDRKQAIMTADHWRIEVEMQEPTAEGRAFDTGKVDAAFLEAVQLQPAVAGAKYGTGGDWAKKVNHTVVVSIRHDIRPAQVVAITRTQKEPWPSMVAKFDTQAVIYKGTGCHDNTGLGQVVHDLLHVDAEPFNMVGRDRADLLSEYIADLEHGEIVWPRDDSNQALAAARSEHRYASRDAIYRGSKDGSTKHHLPDTVSAAALAWRACKGVTAAGAAVDPPADQTPHLQKEVQRDRLTNYVHTAGRRPNAITEGDRPGTAPAPSTSPEPQLPGGRRPLKRKA